MRFSGNARKAPAAKTPTSSPLRELCYDALGEFYLALNPNYDYVGFQQEKIVPALEALERGDFDRLMIFIHAGAAKTDLGTKAFIPWYLGRNAGKNAILITHTDSLARDYGGHIRDTVLRSDVFHGVFPNCQINNLNRASNYFRTSQNNAFYAFGLDGGITGRRADLLVMEDLIKNMQDALSDTVQSSGYDVYKAVLKDRLRPNPRILHVCHRWAVRDIAGRILEAEANRWKVLVLPAENEDGTFLWEEYFGREKYLEAKEDGYIWAAKWMQAPKPALNQGFEENWLRFYVPKLDSQGRERPVEFREDGTILSMPVDLAHFYKRCNMYMFVDPAMGKEAAHDRSCILVFAAGPERRFFLIDAVLDRLDPGERIDHIVRLAREWRVQQILYEEYALQADTYFLKLKLETEEMPDLNVTSVGRKGIKGMRGGRLTKTDRINQLVPDFRDGRVWLPKHMPRTCQDGTKIDIVSYFIGKEYLPWAGEGSIAHEDMLDCMSRLRDPEFSPDFMRRPEDDEDDVSYSSGGGSWESTY